MNTRFKVFASYNILRDLCDFIHVLIFVTVSKFRKSPKLTNIVIIATASTPMHPTVSKTQSSKMNMRYMHSSWIEVNGLFGFVTLIYDHEHAILLGLEELMELWILGDSMGPY